MTLQISEIAIQLAVGSPSPSATVTAAANAPTAGSAPLSEAQIDKLVARCAQLVLEQLRRQQER